MRTAGSKILVSWAVYDFANTIFSAVVLTVYFPLYLTERAGANWYLGAASTASMVLAGLAIPFLGTLSDQTGKTKKYLILATLMAVCFLFLLSRLQNAASLILAFLIACFFYHAALVFYNSLLTVAAPPEKQGFASGLGTGLGYMGVVCSLPLANWVDQHFGRQSVFAASAALFLIFSLPLFLWVPERVVERLPSPSPLPSGERDRVRGLWQSEWKRVLETVRTLPERPELLFFLAGNFFAVDALNATIFWLSVYVRDVFQPGQNTLIVLLMGINATAFLGGILAGFLTDRWGAAKTLILSAGCLAGTLALLAWTNEFRLFAALSMTGGAFAISGTWTAGRKRLVELAPAGKLGGYFGLYGLTTKVSVIGSLVFSIVADLVGMRPALRVLLFPSTVGLIFFILSKVAQDRRKKSGLPLLFQ